MAQAISPINPAVRDFLAAGVPKSQSVSTPPSPESESPPDSEPQLPVPSPSRSEAKPAPRKEAFSEEPGPLVSVTFRLPQKVSEALMKAATDRKIRRVKPQSQQEIAAAALEKWLKNHDYM